MPTLVDLTRTSDERDERNERYERYEYNEYDRLNRLTKSREDWQATAPSTTRDTYDTTTTYTYNGPGWLKTLAEHDGNTTSYMHDDAGRVTRATYPNGSGAAAGQNYVQYGYDAVGNLTSRIDQRGMTTTYSYDDLHRLTKRDYSTISGTDDEVFAYDKSSRLLLADNAVAQLDFGYDALGRLQSSALAYVSGGQSYTTSFAYTVGPTGSTGTVTYPVSPTRNVVYTFDRRQRLTNVDAGTNIGATFGYDIGNRRTTATLGNNVTSVWDYDVNDRLRSIRHAGQVGGLAGYLLDLEYDYTPAGVRFNTANNLTASRSELYTHDKRQRLRGFDRGTRNTARTAITTPLNDAVLPSEQNWGDLDRRGNWLAFDETLNGTTTPQSRTRNGVNEYLTLDPDGGGTGFQPVSFTNDAAGNLTVNPLARNIGDGASGIPSPSGQVYEYDEENRLKAVKRGSDSATLLSMKYDALGRRVESTDHTAASDPCDGTYQPVRTRHVAAGIEPLAEFIECPSGSPPATAWVKAREFVWGAAFPEPLALIDWTEAGATASGSAEVLHYVHQHLGSPAALTNASRDVVERYTYDPYGRTTIENAAGTRLTAAAYGNPFAWTGQRYDAGVKLYHFLFRSYSPEIGRWMQRDPLGYVETANLYEYIGAHPLEGIDPLGLESRPPIAPGPGPQSTQPGTQPSTGPSSQPTTKPKPSDKPTPGKPVPGIKDHKIPAKLGWKYFPLEDYGHRWVQITNTGMDISIGFWPDGVRRPDPKQAELDTDTLPNDQPGLFTIPMRVA